MKKVLILFLVLMFSLVSLFPQSVLADQMSDWTLSGTTAKIVSDGVSFKADTLDTITYAVYKIPLKTDSVTVEITPTYCEKKTDVDAWIGVSFMGVPSMFSLDQQATTPGFVSLFYNYKGTFRITLDGYMKDIYNGRDSWRLMEKGTPLKVGQKNKIELKWDSKENFYHLIINDVQLDDNAQLMIGKKEVIFPTGNKYILVGSYTQSGQPAEFTINSINGVELGGTSNSQGKSSSAVSIKSTSSSEIVSKAESSSDIIAVNSEAVSEISTESSIEASSSAEESIVSENNGMASSDDTKSKDDFGIWTLIFIIVGVLAVVAAAFLVIKFKVKKG